MATPSPTEARFPAVAEDRGHYESWYLKACHPAEPMGVWIRYTVHKRPGEGPTGSLWFTLFDRDGAPWASKVTLPAPGGGEGAFVSVGESTLDGSRAAGSANEASWELEYESAEPPLFHLPREWMYRAPVPRTKLLSPLPAARFSGRLSVDGRAVDVDGWRGMMGHNWGAQHAERWIWTHAAGFEDQPDSTWLDAAIGRIKLGPLTTPWIANGALSLEGERHALGGPGRVRATEVRERPDGAELVLPVRDLSVRLSVSAPREAFVGWVYADPDGPEHHTVNCSASDMDVRVERSGRPPLELRVRGGAAYELGMRERDHGMAIQPFPDG